MNVNRVNMTSFGHGDYYNDIKRGCFCYAPNNMSDAYKFGAIYSMLEVIRDEQKEQAKIIAQNQVVLRNMLSDMARDNGKYHDDEFYANDVYETSKHRINTIA